MTRGALTAALVLALGVAGVARVQPRLADAMHAVKADDVYLLPPPAELRAMTLGYHAATADALWAMLLVAYGTHWQEKRPFSDAPRYLDGILALEPTFPLVYSYADTLIIYRPPRGTEEDWYTAKRYLERGLKERPYDHKVWLHYGQYMAFTSLSFVTDPEKLQTFRRQGAEAILHAVELGAEADRSVAAATLLSKYGEKDEAVGRLRNFYLLTDDPQQRQEIARKLQQLEASAARDDAERDARALEARWRKEYAFLSRDAYMLLGPMADPVACAGRGKDGACAGDWTDALAAETGGGAPPAK